MDSDKSGLKKSPSGLPEYLPPHVVQMNGLRGGFGACTVPGAGNETAYCAVGAANTGYDSCFEGTTNTHGFCHEGTTNYGTGDCKAGTTNSGVNCEAGGDVASGSCVAGGNHHT